jgi:ABC-type transporter MlaC component
MLKKTFLILLSAIATTTTLMPTALFAKPVQKSMMKVEQATNVGFEKEKQDIKKLINKHFNALNAGDSAGFLSTFSPNSAQYNVMTQNNGIIRYIKDSGIICSIQKVEYIQVSSRQAEIKVTALTTIRKTKTQVTSGHTKLEKVNGRWLITSLFNEKYIGELGSSTNKVTSEALPDSARPASAQDRKIFQQVFAKHLSALNQEKLGDYLATLDATSPNYGAAKASTLKLFKNYDLKYELKNVEVLSLSKQEAVVKLIANVKKIKGGEFTDSQLVTINTIHKTNGQWRIYDTQVENISNLNTPKAKIAKR